MEKRAEADQIANQACGMGSDQTNLLK